MPSVLRELGLLLILGIVFKASSLIWGFTIYFILWHSIPSLLDQITFIFGDLEKKSIFKYAIAALPYWLISLIGISVLFLIFKNEKHFYSLFFAFIAAVTFPHAIVMLKMFTKKSAWILMTKKKHCFTTVLFLFKCYITLLLQNLHLQRFHLQLVKLLNPLGGPGLHCLGLPVVLCTFLRSPPSMLHWFFPEPAQ